MSRSREDTVVDTSSRLRIATKINFALLRYLGEGIDVGAMLKRPSYATEVLYVCRGSRDRELGALADQFEAAPHADVRMPASHAAALADTHATEAPQDAAWAENTTGFGVTRPMLATDVAASCPRTATPSGAPRWYEARRWFN